MKLGKSYRKIFPAMLFVNHVLHEFKNVKFDVLWTSLETQRKCGMRAFSFAGKQKLKSTLTDKSVAQKAAKKSLLPLSCRWHIKKIVQGNCGRIYCK